MSYNSAENYILPLSHDEVVHLKCSMVNKMPGYQVDKYANLRLGYAYMLGHSGKKLLFMGQEFGQEREWSEARELDWYLIGENKLNEGMLHYSEKLLDLYHKYPCLYRIDNSWDGFEWINADDRERSIYSFFRKCRDSKKAVMFVLNMTPVEYKDYRVGAPCPGTYRVLVNSMDAQYGGFGNVQLPASIKAKTGECDYRPQYLAFDLPAYGGIIFEFTLK